jgi:polyhydroxyalkanoate synthesis regulator phasin
MKAKTLLELMTLSSNLYMLSKDEDLMNKVKSAAEKGKERINKAVSEPILDEDGNEMEFIDKLIHKAGQAKDELEEKIEELVVKFYNKINIAHVDEVRALSEKLDKADRSIALLEARLNKLENK